MSKDALLLLLILGSYLGLNYHLWQPGDRIPEAAAPFLSVVTLFVVPAGAYYLVMLRFFEASWTPAWKRHAYALASAFVLTLASAFLFLVWMVIMFYQIPP